MTSTTSLDHATHELPGGGHGQDSRGRAGRGAGRVGARTSGGGTAQGASRTTGRGAGRTLGRRLASGVTTLLVLAAGAVFAFLAVGPHVLGYRTTTMLTASMAPAIEPGDVVVTVPVPVHEVAVGDVITYEIPVQDRRVETHRVVSVTTTRDGRVEVTTKGDANSAVDPWVAVLEGDTAWRTTHVVRHLGSVVRTFREPFVQTWVLWGAVGTLVLTGMTRIWRSGGGRTDG